MPSSRRLTLRSTPGNRKLLALTGLLLTLGLLLASSSLGNWPAVRHLFEAGRYEDAILRVQEGSQQGGAGSRLAEDILWRSRLAATPEQACQLLESVARDSRLPIPARQRLNLELAELQFGRGRFQECLGTLNYLLADDPESLPGEAYILAGMTHRLLGQLQKAREMFASVRPGDPAFPRARYFLGDIGLQQGDHNLALRYFESGLQNSGDRNQPDLLGGQWQALRLADRGSDAAGLREQLARHSPGSLALLDINRILREEEENLDHKALERSPADSVVTQQPQLPAGRFSLQIGAFSDRSLALEYLARHQADLDDLRVDQVQDQRGQFLYKVRTGHFVNPALARAEAARLRSELGIDVIVIDGSTSFPTELIPGHEQVFRSEPEEQEPAQGHTHAGPVSGNQESASRFPLAVPHGGFLRNFFRRCPDPGPGCRCHPDQPGRQERAPGAAGRCSLPCSRNLSDPFAGGGTHGGHLRADRGPGQAKGLVKREVVEIISPGTATSPELVQSNAGHYCLSWAQHDQHEQGWALLDASTGEFRCGQEFSSLESLCRRHPVREVIVPEATSGDQLQAWRAALPEVVVNTVNDAWYHPSFARQTLRDHFQVANLTVFGLEEERRTPAARAAGSLLRYLSSLTLEQPRQVTTLRYSDRSGRLVLDEETINNLEIFRTFRGEKGEGTLVHHLDRTRTPMGRRFLERRLAEALTDIKELESWHRGVAGALEHRSWRQELRHTLSRVGDMERLAARAASGRIGPSALRQLGLTLAALIELKEQACREPYQEQQAARWAQQLSDFSALAGRITTAIDPEAPATLRKPGFISPGVSEELDHCRTVAADSKGFLAGLQNQEREATGIPTLKVGFNRVFGYYFDITKKHLDKVPEHYEQKQTLVNSCRFHTPELKEAETTILEAEERAEALEQEIFQTLLESIREDLDRLHTAADLVAHLDLMLAFADLAEEQDYCRPRCDDGLELEISQGRHPVVEQILEGDFIPNDTHVNGDDPQVLLLTGPNMGGKSTYLRQVALITLMAQAGSFVPARSAHLGVADRIFTRVGASDNLARGESTFYMEMSETAHILHQMSRRSLVILDEIGRGTSTYDGLSLAWAITEFLADAAGPRPRSIFATHYHELTELEKDLPGLVNLRLEVREWEGKIIFLHTVVPGCSDESYGIHVAELAGLPATVLHRAKAILESLAVGDRRDLQARRPGSGQSGLPGGFSGPQAQLSLFQESERDALDALRELDLDHISPMDAFMWLARIKKQLGQ
jgi:DNA mismatch repair protein MutS